MICCSRMISVPFSLPALSHLEKSLGCSTSKPGRGSAVLAVRFRLGTRWDGRRAEAQQTPRHLESLRSTRCVDAMVVAFLGSALKDREGLRLWFQRVYEERATLFVYTLMRGVYFAAGDPQVDALIAKQH
jgi:hypothetical protein